MDSEALVTNQADKELEEAFLTERRSRTPVFHIQFLLLGAILLGSAALGGFLSTRPSSTPDLALRTVVSDLQVVLDDDDDDDATTTAEMSMDAWSVGKKIHPPHPKKLHHGEVLYKTVEDATEGRYYDRQFLIPCGYGLLVFNIGPADTNMPYDFDVYDDGYIFSNNGDMCVFYPSYKAHQNGPTPFWMPEDPTSFRVPLGDKLTKISSRVNKHPHTKETSKAVVARGGDYLVMTKGDFYTPHYYQELKQMVNTWKAAAGGDSDNDLDIDQMIQQAIEELSN